MSFLGDAVQVTRGVRNLEQTLPFYEQLGFRKIGADTRPYPWAQLTDGALLLTLGQDGREYAGLTFFAADMAERVEKLKARDLQVQRADFNIGDHFQALLVDPDGFGIGLIGFEGANIHKPGGEPLSKCGQFQEVSLEVSDLEVSLAFWEKAGFELEYTHPLGGCYGLNDGLIRVGLYRKGFCRHPFRNPSLTWFEPDMAERIQRLKDEGVHFIYEMRDEAGVVNEAIAEAPDGQYFFLFSA